MNLQNPKFIHRFYNKITIGEDCHFWKGALNSQGYGSITLKGRSLYAHRVALALSQDMDTVPKGNIICRHLCNEASCVNPAHLCWGTQKENMRDLLKIGGGICSFTLQQALDLRAQFKICTRDFIKDQAKKYKVRPELIERILQNETYITEVTKER